MAIDKTFLDENGLSLYDEKIKEVIRDNSGHTIVNSSGTEMNARSKLKFTGADITDDAVNDTTNVTIQGGGSGHIVLNSSGTQMAQRGKIQFNNATVADDSTNNKTIVTIPEGLQLGTTSTTALKGDTKYAGSSSAGGAATSANKLNTNAGNTTTPVYFENGVPKALGYTLAKSVPSDAIFTDTNTKVTQTASTTNANYRVLMSATADDTTRTEASVKSSKIYGNPSTGNLQVTQLNGVTVGTSPKFTDTTYSAVTSLANGLAISTDKAKFDAMAFISYGTCTTAAGTQEKVATLANSNWSLKTGSFVGIKFTNTNTYNATSSNKITLNVNNTGAKPIYGYGSAANTGTNTTLYGRANYINYYMYDGTNWVWAGSSGDNDTTYRVQNEAGTTMTHRTKIQFIGATVTDDSTNSRTVVKISGDGGVWTTPVSCLVGDTTATITNTAIKTTSIIDAYSEASSGVPLSYKSMQVSAGQCVITFNALTEATNIRLKITNL